MIADLLVTCGRIALDAEEEHSLSKDGLTYVCDFDHSEATNWIVYVWGDKIERKGIYVEPFVLLDQLFHIRKTSNLSDVTKFAFKYFCQL